MDAGPPGAGDALKTCGIPSGQTCFLLRMGCNHESIVKKSAFMRLYAHAEGKGPAFFIDYQGILQS